MQVFHKLEDVPPQLGPTMVSVGNFDGVHLAHQEVVRRMAESAPTLGGKAVVVTFEPHPLRILRPDVAPKLLAPLPVKLKLLEQAGVDAVLVLPFTRDLSLMSAQDFAREVLVGDLACPRSPRGLQLSLRPQGPGERAYAGRTWQGIGFRSGRLFRAIAARASRLQQRDPQASCGGRSGQGARACWDARSASSPIPGVAAATVTSTPCRLSICRATTRWFLPMAFTSPGCASAASASRR